MFILKPIIITAISMAILAFLVPAVSFSSWAALIIAAIILTLLQMVVRPVLKILFLPINIITLGLFGWVINALILWLAMLAVPGFMVGSITLLGVTFGTLMSLIIVSFFLSIIQTLVDSVI